MNDIPPMQVTPPRRSFWRNLSLVWAIPVLAIIVSLGIAWRSYKDRGALIEITFQNAGGVVARETSIRLRDVPIGLVEAVRFSDDLQHVIVSARVNKEVAENIPEDAQFWIVRPQVSARGISGLNTVLSGVYVEAAFVPQAYAEAWRFTGLETPPLLMPGKAGQLVTLRATDSNRLTAGAPVIFRGIQVGHIEQPRIIEGEEGIWVDAFIEDPHHKRLTTATRFWDMSGFSVSFGMSGLKLGVGNLASLLTGGIAFDTLTSTGEPLKEGAVFDLFADESTARQSGASETNANALRVSVNFDQSIQGLSSGAEVRYNGIKVGQVTGVSARVLTEDGLSRITVQASLALIPQEMGLPETAGPFELEAFLKEKVSSGLRAQLAPTGLLGTTLVVELVEAPEAAAAQLQKLEGGLPQIPSIHADLPDFRASGQGLLDRMSKLPIEGLIQQAISLMSAAEQLVSQDSTRAVPDAVRNLLDETRSFIGGSALRDLPAEALSVMSGLREVLQSFKDQNAVERLTSALQAVETAANDLSTEVPPALADLRAVLSKAENLKAEDLIAAATSLMDGADDFIRADTTRMLAPALSGALQELKLALEELRAGGTVENVNATLASTRSAADAIALAAKDLPALAQRLDDLVSQAEALVSAYGANSPVNSEILTALREARSTARAFSQLARTIERNPNSLLFGR